MSTPASVIFCPSPLLWKHQVTCRYESAQPFNLSVGAPLGCAGSLRGVGVGMLRKAGWTGRGGCRQMPEFWAWCCSCQHRWCFYCERFHAAWWLTEDSVIPGHGGWMLWGGGVPVEGSCSWAPQLGRPAASKICSLAMQGAHAKERALDAMKHVGRGGERGEKIVRCKKEAILLSAE